MSTQSPSPQAIVAMLQERLADVEFMRALLPAHLMLSPASVPMALFTSEETRLVDATKRLLSRLDLGMPLHAGWLSGMWDRAAADASRIGLDDAMPWIRWQVLGEILHVVAVGRLAWEE